MHPINVIQSFQPLVNRHSDQDLQRMLRDPELKEKAFRELMDCTQERLYRLVYRMTGNHEDTDDLLQEIFIKAWLHVERFVGNSTLFTWLYRIAVNETLNFLERRTRKRTGNLPEGSSPGWQNAASDFPLWQEKTWQEALAQLPPRQRLVFGLRYYEELDYRQIAALLHLSEGALKASFHHATQKIRHYLSKHQ